MFDLMAKFSDVLFAKAELSNNIKLAYKSNDTESLKNLVKEVRLLNRKIKIFYEAEKNMWDKECKPQGFDILDLRFGGIILRNEHVIAILKDFIEGKVKNIPELDQEILPLYKEQKSKKLDYQWGWWRLFSISGNHFPD